MSTENKGSFGDALIGALEEAVAHERGEVLSPVCRVEHTARYTQILPPPEYTPDHIRDIRLKLSMSQQVFADLLNASASAVRAWEQGAREPDGPTRRLLQLAERHPDVLTELLTGEKPYPLHAHTGVLIAAEPRIPYGTPRDPSARK